MSLCQNAGTLDLKDMGNPKGGIFSGQGVNNNVLDPSGLSAGDYKISYTLVNAAGCSVSNTFTLTVLPVPGIPTITGTTQGCDGTQVQITASTASTKDIIFHWYKENATSPFFTGPILSYIINGSQKLYCVAENSLACASSKALVNITSFNPKGDFQADKTAVPFGGLVKFTSTVNGASYNWDFGDGGTAIIQNPAHYYNNSGIFTVILTSTSSQGCSTQILKTKYIQVSDQQAAVQPIQQSSGDGNDPYSSPFNVYPSPFQNYIRVNFQLKKSQFVNFDFYDEKGQHMLHMGYNGLAGSNTLTLNEVQSLSRGGFYFLKISSQEINRVEKLLKM